MSSPPYIVHVLLLLSFLTSPAFLCSNPLLSRKGQLMTMNLDRLNRLLSSLSISANFPPRTLESLMSIGMGSMILSIGFQIIWALQHPRLVFLEATSTLNQLFHLSSRPAIPSLDSSHSLTTNRTRLFLIYKSFKAATNLSLLASLDKRIERDTLGRCVFWPTSPNFTCSK